MKKAYAGIDIGGSHVKFGLCHLDGSIIHSDKADVGIGGGRDVLLGQVIDCAKRLLELSSEAGFTLESVGIGTPGIVDHNTGCVIGMSPNLPGWEGTEIKKEVEAAIDIEVCVDNDVNVMTLAEVVFGAARGYRHVIATTVGTGVGGGIVIDGKLYRGSIGGAGEFGHITVVKDGEICGCGKRGCLEAYASATALLREAHALSNDTGNKSRLSERFANGGEITVGEIFRLAENDGDRDAGNLVDQAADYLAVGLSSIISVLNPEVVIVGGGMADAGGDYYMNLVEKHLESRTISSHFEHLKLRRAALGNRAGFVGAGILKDFGY